MVSVIKKKVNTHFEKLLESFLHGTRDWNIDIAGFTLGYSAPDHVGQPGVLALTRGSTIYFHSHPNGAVGCVMCESGNQAEHDAITAQLIKIYSKQ